MVCNPPGRPSPLNDKGEHGFCEEERKSSDRRQPWKSETKPSQPFFLSKRKNELIEIACTPEAISTEEKKASEHPLPDKLFREAVTDVRHTEDLTPSPLSKRTHGFTRNALLYATPGTLKDFLRKCLAACFEDSDNAEISPWMFLKKPKHYCYEIKSNCTTFSGTSKLNYYID